MLQMCVFDCYVMLSVSATRQRHLECLPVWSATRLFRITS